MTRPLVIVTLRDLSKVKTRWRTVAVAMSIERSSPVCSKGSTICSLKVHHVLPLRSPPLRSPAEGSELSPHWKLEGGDRV